jgi:hypothetical protein
LVASDTQFRFASSFSRNLHTQARGARRLAVYTQVSVFQVLIVTAFSLHGRMQVTVTRRSHPTYVNHIPLKLTAILSESYLHFVIVTEGQAIDKRNRICVPKETSKPWLQWLHHAPP